MKKFPGFANPENNKNSYGFSLLKLDSFEDTPLDSDGFYYSKGIYYFFRPSKQNARQLVVNFNGAYGPGITSRIVFRGYNYSIDDTDVLCVCDSLLLCDDRIRLAWYLDSIDFSFNDLYQDLFRAIIGIRNCYSEIIFTGSSGGGLPSIRFAGLFKGTAIVANPQIYHYKYYYYRSLLELLGGEGLAPFELTKHVLSYPPNRIIIFQNRLDKEHLEGHVMPFCGELEKQGMSRFVELNVFDHDLSSSPAAPHDYPYPSGRKHLEVLKGYIYFKNLFVRLSADAYCVGDRIFASSELLGVRKGEESDFIYAFYLIKGQFVLGMRSYNQFNNASFSLREIGVAFQSGLAMRAFAMKKGLPGGRLIVDCLIRDLN